LIFFKSVTALEYILTIMTSSMFKRPRSDKTYKIIKDHS